MMDIWRFAPESGCDKKRWPFIQVPKLQQQKKYRKQQETNNLSFLYYSITAAHFTTALIILWLSSLGRISRGGGGPS
ncbi:hypothetical protein vseg_019272 [Gypsophila vaccaria]